MNEPKPPKPPERTSGTSGEHMLKLGQLKSPVGTSPLPPRPEQEFTCPTIDFDKLEQAWELSVDVQRELIRVIARNEEDNKTTRADAARTRRFVAFGAIFGVIAVAATITWGSLEFQAVRRENTAELTQLAKTSVDVQETLKAVRAMAKALGAKVEADAALTPQSESKSLKAGVEAQAAALEAESKVAPTPEARAKASTELKVVQEKAKLLGNGDGGP